MDTEIEITPPRKTHFLITLIIHLLPVVVLALILSFPEILQNVEITYNTTTILFIFVEGVIISAIVVFAFFLIKYPPNTTKKSKELGRLFLFFLTGISMVILLGITYSTLRGTSPPLATPELMFMLLFQVLTSIVAWIVFIQFSWPSVSIIVNEEMKKIMLISKHGFNEKRIMAKISDIGHIIILNRKVKIKQENIANNVNETSRDDSLVVKKILGGNLPNLLKGVHDIYMVFLKRDIDPENIKKEDLIAKIGLGTASGLTRVFCSLACLLSKHGVTLYTNIRLTFRPDHLCGDPFTLDRMKNNAKRYEILSSGKNLFRELLVSSGAKKDDLDDNPAGQDLSRTISPRDVFDESYQVSEDSLGRLVLVEKKDLEQLECITSSRIIIFSAIILLALISIASFLASVYFLLHPVEFIIGRQFDVFGLFFTIGFISVIIIIAILESIEKIKAINKYTIGNNKIIVELVQEERVLEKHVLTPSLFINIEKIETPLAIKMNMAGGDFIVFYLNNNTKTTQALDVLYQYFMKPTRSNIQDCT